MVLTFPRRCFMAAIGRNSSVGDLSHGQRELRLHRMLTCAACLFAAALVLHGADHLRRGLAVVTPEVLWGGALLSMAGSIAVVLVLGGHRLAPLIAVAVGFPTAAGVVASHLLPRWSALSDSFLTNGADLVSWAAVLAEIAAAFALGVAGARAWRSADTA
jgi:hypothetical protein